MSCSLILLLMLLCSIGQSFAFLLQHQHTARIPPLQAATTNSNILLSNKACTSTLGGFRIVAEEAELTDEEIDMQQLQGEFSTIRLTNVGSGWGNGAHPTTRLCFNFLARTVTNGQTVLDYGTGSGILAILAAKLGAKHVVAVDIDDDTLEAAAKNARLNGVDAALDIAHTRYVYVGEDRFPVSDVTVANILPGALSMLAATLWSFTKVTVACSYLCYLLLEVVHL